MSINHDALISNLELDRIGEFLQARLAKKMDEDPRSPSVLELVGTVVLICLEEDMMTGYIQQPVALATLVEVNCPGHWESQKWQWKVAVREGSHRKCYPAAFPSSNFVKCCQPDLSRRCSAGSDWSAANALSFLMTLSSSPPLPQSLLNSYETS